MPVKAAHLIIPRLVVGTLPRLVPLPLSAYRAKHRELIFQQPGRPLLSSERPTAYNIRIVCPAAIISSPPWLWLFSLRLFCENLLEEAKTPPSYKCGQWNPLSESKVILDRYMTTSAIAGGDVDTLPVTNKCESVIVVPSSPLGDNDSEHSG